MKKPEFKEAMINFKEWSKASSYLELLAKNKAPMDLYKGRGRKVWSIPWGY